jgi:hypothetical protein
MSYVVHHKDVQKGALTLYSLRGAILLAFVMRVEERARMGGELCGVQLSELQMRLANELRRRLSEAETTGQEDAEIEIPFDEGGAEEVEDEEEDECEENDKDEEEGTQVDLRCEDDRGLRLLTDRILGVQRAIAELLFALFSQFSTDQQQDKWFSPVYRLVAYLSRRQDGTYLAPGVITQIIAALTFIGRLTMFWVMHKEVHKHKGISYKA